MKRPWVFLTLASVAVGAVVAVRRARSVKSPAILEAQFHHAYDRVREQAAHAAPVLVLFGESLILFDGGRQTQWVATAPATQLIQAAAHMPVGIFALKQDNAEAPLEAATLLRLSAMRSAQLRVRTQLDQLEEPARSDVATLLERSQVFIDHAVVQGHLPDADISRFASETGPLLLRLIEHATRLELTALHAAADAALAELSADKLQTLEVVVAGVHQARARSLGLQNFQRRFGE
jgi:hypothetical protein